MRTTLLMLAMLAVAAGGCQRRGLLKSDDLSNTPNGELSDAYKDKLMSQSLAQYARKQRLSPEEAAGQLRRQANEAAAAGHGCGCVAGSHAPGGAVQPASGTYPDLYQQGQVDQAAYFDAPLSGAPLRR